MAGADVEGVVLKTSSSGLTRLLARWCIRSDIADSARESPSLRVNIHDHAGVRRRSTSETFGSAIDALTFRQPG
jgi:hypothetical protein